MDDNNNSSRDTETHLLRIAAESLRRHRPVTCAVFRLGPKVDASEREHCGLVAERVEVEVRNSEGGGCFLQQAEAMSAISRLAPSFANRGR